MINRIRTTGGISTIPKTSRVTNCDGVITTTSGTFGKTGTYKVTGDVLKPGFEKIRKSGGIVNNPFYTTENIYSSTMGGYNHWHSCVSANKERYEFIGPVAVSWLGQLEPVTVIQDYEIGSLITEACTSALSHVQEATFESLVALAELKKTVELIRHPLENLARFLSRKNLGGDRYSALEWSRDEWLKYRYGVRPLLYDVSKAAEAIQSALKPRSPRKTARATRSLSKSSTNVLTYNNATYFINYSVFSTDTVVVRGGCLYEWDLRFAGATDFGFMPHQLPSAAWELVPYSFVVDWFANVGDFIKAITPQIGTSSLADWHSVTRTVTTTRVITNSGLQPAAVSAGWVADVKPAGTDTALLKSKTRSPYLPIGVTFKTDSLESVLASARVIDLIALIQQRLR